MNDKLTDTLVDGYNKSDLFRELMQMVEDGRVSVSMDDEGELYFSAIPQKED
jgi:hypothetical protein